MNRNGRLVGGVLVGIALLWILRILGALPFSDRTTNQIGQNQIGQNQIGQNQASAQTPPDRPPIADFDATRTSIANFNPGTGTQGLTTPGSGTVAQNPGTTTGNGATSGIGTTTGSGTGTGSGASTQPAPVVPGAW